MGPVLFFRTAGVPRRSFIASSRFRACWSGRDRHRRWHGSRICRWRRGLNRQRGWDNRVNHRRVYGNSGWSGRADDRGTLPAASRKQKPDSATGHKSYHRNQQHYFPDPDSGRRPAPFLKQITGNVYPSVRTVFFVSFMLDFFQGIKDITHTVRSLSGEKPLLNSAP